ncbi:MAG TPA: pilus (MSHA type) biogenesis protein MshL [Rheinheimera sp.]|uniref:pilus (MSHA type) biogenesis protein MshL n=1 Tax=Rheinheimera sp. TaxID=1869214 RepID=UPI000EE6DAE9|nr:pilus (MSHA type) biogenesis protein MshL [Rheinheimera sp.]HCU65697.1 pilus (MSHA type) biogenesis protein MshL [Rheinheimera sp.]
MRTKLSLLASIIALSACQSIEAPKAASNTSAELGKLQQQQAAPKAVPLQVPAAVTDDLLTPMAPPTANLLLPRINVSALNVAMPDFFASLVADTEQSIVVHPDVQGQISLQLKQVTLPEVMQVVQQMYGFDIRQQGNVWQVYPAGLRTETIAVNYLLMQRMGMSSIAVNSGGVSQDNQSNRNGNNRNNQSGQNNQNGFNDNNLNNGQQNNQQFNGSMIQSGSKTDFWKDLEKAVAGILGGGEQRTVVVSPQAGLVTVRGMPDEIAAVRAFLTQSEQHLQRQVILEAKIIEVTLSDDYQQGINWQNALTNIDSTSLRISNAAGNFGNPINTAIGGLTSISFQNADFNGVISLLETQGDAQVLSSPRVTAINNQKAVIKVGQDEYFVTEISSNTTTAANGVQNTTPTVILQPFFSGIALDVTPQIDQNGQVILHVHPSVTETAEQTKTVQLSEEKIVLPLAQSNIRESDTIIKASNGEIVVIGGLMQTVINDTESGVPGLMSIPVVGSLFKSMSKTEKKKELVILLKPTVVQSGVWQQQIQQSGSQVQDWAAQR